MLLPTTQTRGLEHDLYYWGYSIDQLRRNAEDLENFLCVCPSPAAFLNYYWRGLVWEELYKILRLMIYLQVNEVYKFTEVNWRTFLFYMQMIIDEEF